MERDIDVTLRQYILAIIHDNWGSFYEGGVSRPMLDFEFCLDTGNSPTVCCRQLLYGFHESKIMTAQIADLEANGILLIVKEPGVPYFCLPRNPTRKATTISIPSFGDFVLATDH